MSDSRRWLGLVIAVVLLLGVVGLIAYARGDDHHHGDEIGTHGSPPTAATTP